jgi:hypothetical protein
MKKIISYSIFGSRTTAKENRFVFNAYLRGLVWNVKMNAIVYEGWQSHVEVDSGTFSDYDNIFYGLKRDYGMSFGINNEQPLCMSMLWRLKPVFNKENDIVLCRDADALTSYRESKAVNEWLESDKIIHSIKDNPAHSLPLMGGMIGFKCEPIREKYGTWEDLIMKAQMDLSQRGSDQDLMMKIIYPDFKESILQKDMTQVPINDFANYASTLPMLYCSNLCSVFIGAAGVNDLETVRYFLTYGQKGELDEIENRYPQIFYWK